MAIDFGITVYPRTQAVRQALASVQDGRAVADLLFLETWVHGGTGDLAATLRAAQIRRANPGLVAAIQQELSPR